MKRVRPQEYVKESYPPEGVVDLLRSILRDLVPRRRDHRLHLCPPLVSRADA